MSNMYAYMRVSSKEQNEDRQVIALSVYPIPKGNIYLDKKSGKDFNRPAYRRLLKRLKPGDILYIKSIDRLGRNYEEIMEQWRVITKEKQADIKVLDMPLLDTSYAKDLLGTFIADLVLQIMSFTAQNERENIRQRQSEGIAAAKARGVRFGREARRLPENFDTLYRMWRDGEITGEEVAEQCGMALGTVYRKLREQGDVLKDGEDCVIN